MKLAYVSGAYRSDEGRYGEIMNIFNAAYVAHELWEMGFSVICPHKNTEGFEGDGLTVEQILLGDKEMIKRCDCIVMLGSWRHSPGAKLELGWAQRAKKKVFYWPTDEMSLLKYAEG